MSAEKKSGFQRWKPWVFTFGGALSVPFSRHGEKGTIKSFGMYFSPLVGRKVPKEAPLKGKTHGFSLEKPFSSRCAQFCLWQNCNALSSWRFAAEPQRRWSNAVAGNRPNRFADVKVPTVWLLGRGGLPRAGVATVWLLASGRHPTG